MTTSQAPKVLTEAMLRVLVVEDDADTSRFFAIYLKALGHFVRTATSVADALAELGNADFDVMMVDIGLPDGSGWEFMRIVRDFDPPRQEFAIAVTGYSADSDRARSMEAGFRHHLVKPLDAGRLAAVLDEVRSERALRDSDASARAPRRPPHIRLVK